MPLVPPASSTRAFFIVWARWRFWTRFLWSRWKSPIFSWIAPRLGTIGAVYKLLFPIELTSLCLDRHGHKGVGTFRVVHNRNYWHLTPTEKKVVPSILIFFFKISACINKRTFFISAMLSFGSLDEVVFMLHVNLKDLGLTSVPSFTALLLRKKRTKKKENYYHVEYSTNDLISYLYLTGLPQVVPN